MLQKQISGIGDRKSEKKSVSDRQSAAFIVGQCLKDALGVSSGLVLAYRPIDSKNEDGVLAIVGQSDNGINSIYNRLKNNIDGLLPGTIQIEDDDGWYLLVSLDYDDLIFGCVVLGPKPDHKKFSSDLFTSSYGVTGFIGSGFDSGILSCRCGRFSYKGSRSRMG